MAAAPNELLGLGLFKSGHVLYAYGMGNHNIHLICGGTGAGKTTYALKLCASTGAVLFSIDDWMRVLFWIDLPQPPVADWSLERVERCLIQIWSTASQVASRGVSCVLDVGSGRASDRARITELARSAGFSMQLHFLDVPAEERWRRVLARNAKRESVRQLDFEITREMFDFVESRWEPPDDGELSQLNGLKVSSTGSR